MITARITHGASFPENYLPVTADPGDWQLTPNCSALGGSNLHWGKVTPFGLLSADEFRSKAPPLVTGLKYRGDYLEVQEMGSLGSTARHIHFRFDQEAGGRQGKSVGQYIYEHHLRRAR